MGFYMMHASQVEPGLLRRLDDLQNELAYLQSYPERFSKIELLSRKLAVISMIKQVRRLLVTWAMPIELVAPASTEGA